MRFARLDDLVATDNPVHILDVFMGKPDPIVIG
jgi:hypothetical protein